MQITNNFKLTLYLLDLSGLKSFVKIRKLFYKYSDAVLLLFDYTNNNTFERLTDWIDESRHFLKDNTTPIILLGNKFDKIEDREYIKSKTNKLAEQYNFPFFETSAITGEGIDELFTYLISILF
ncbi:MAG: Rab family GTPase [Promethearchaeota archaeon]